MEQLREAGNLSRSFARISLPFFNLTRRSSVHQFIRILDFQICTFLKLLVDCNGARCYRSRTFDEDLHKHINHELADNVGRESDTS